MEMSNDMAGFFPMTAGTTEEERALFLLAALVDGDCDMDRLLALAGGTDGLDLETLDALRAESDAVSAEDAGDLSAARQMAEAALTGHIAEFGFEYDGGR